MPHTRSIETTLAAWSLVGGLAANFAGLLLIGKGGLVGAMLLVAAADRKHTVLTPPSPD